MHILFFLIFSETLANSHVDSAERKTTYIKLQAAKIATITKDFYESPNAPMLFYNHQILKEEVQKLEQELLKIHISN